MQSALATLKPSELQVRLAVLAQYFLQFRRNLGAHPAKDAALRVERFCKCEGGTASEAEQAIGAIEHESIALKAALLRY